MVFLTVDQVAKYENVGDRAIRKRIAEGRIKAKEVKSNVGRGGKSYEIPLTSLSAEARERYYAENNLQAAPEFEPDVLAQAPEYNRKKAYKYLSLLQAADGLKGDALRQFLAAWTRQTGVSCSYAAFLRERKRYDQGGAGALTARYGNRRGNTRIDDVCFDYFKRHYMIEGGRSAEEVWRQTLGYAKSELGLDAVDFPTSGAFLRRLHNDVGEAALYLARRGPSAYNRKFGEYVDRRMNMAAGHVWVSDHAQADVLVWPSEMPAAARVELAEFGVQPRQKRRTVRPWLTVWRDFKTGKWLGWSIHAEPPCTDHILAAFFHAVTRWGLPKAVYVDNGKDYRSRDFAGGRRVWKLEVDEIKFAGMVGALGIRAHFSAPYNAQTKPIERDFKNWHAWVDRGLPGYTGSTTPQKPEKLRDELKKGQIIDMTDFAVLAEQYIDIIGNTPSKGKHLRGQSPEAAFRAEFAGLAQVDADELKLWCMRSSSTQTLQRNGWRDPDIGWFYYSEWMLGAKGRRVYMRRDPARWQIGWFFDADSEEYLGKAQLIAPTAGLAETDVEKAQLDEALRRKKRARKTLEALAEVGRPEDAFTQAMHRAAAFGDAGSYDAPTRNEFVVTRLHEVAKDERLPKTGTDDAPGRVVRFFGGDE